MPFAGLDVHKKETEAVLMDDDTGRVLLRERFLTRRERLEQFARRHLNNCAVALEATTNTWAIVGIFSRW